MTSLGACRRSDAPAGDESKGESSCAQAVADEWPERTDADANKAIAAAKACAKTRGVRVLLAFGAPWCADCREMLQLDQDKRVAAVLREKYEVVRINVGDWDRHAKLREKYGVTAIANYVVLDPSDGSVVAQTTLEPATGGGEKLSAKRWAAWLRDPQPDE